MAADAQYDMPEKSGLVTNKENAMTHHTLRLFPWFAYEGRESLEQLKQHSDALDGISIFGEKDPSREFLAFCRKRGIATLKLVAGDASKLGDASHFDTPARARSTVRRCCGCARKLAMAESTGLRTYPARTERPLCRVAERFRGLARRGRRMSICVHGLTRGAWPPGILRFLRSGSDRGDLRRSAAHVLRHFFAYDGITGPTTARLWAREVM